ncbi:aminoacyl-tRNA hydrolase [Clostridium cellulovorans]|uniref:Peptidyl-tRNA hydrolase n=1 Tax=Clostridium cellulovorans (strain ATCC 35296 / DSM 3052 / OCM 3 / 743B) TaxID=573061 RepID=D9SKQ2_CLOC7|nr:aminoacyl-tRNA hydrolase [Clostridium cellulovorans]ADL53474.1 peptidyl-tRNA hydrolase [Clostridium cellulovorans 743B]
MFVIFGLGNIGKEYESTRHNVGFEVVDILADKYNIQVNRVKFKGEIGEGFINNEKVILVKPTTYMNLSGECVREVMDFYKIPKENLIVIYDDISLDVGKLRIRQKGSAGGHNGIKNILLHLGNDVFPRVKVGVGAPKGNLINHVLGRFQKEEQETMNKVYDVAAQGVLDILNLGVLDAMNKYNGIIVE